MLLLLLSFFLVLRIAKVYSVINYVPEFYDEFPILLTCWSQFRNCGIKALGYPLLLWLSTLSAYMCAFSITNYALWSTWQATFDSDWQGYSRTAVLPLLWEVCRFIFQDLVGWLGRRTRLPRSIQWRQLWSSAASREDMHYELVSDTEGKATA